MFRRLDPAPAPARMPGPLLARATLLCAALLGIWGAQGCMVPTHVAAPEPARIAGPSNGPHPSSLFLVDLTSHELRDAVAGGFTTALVYSGGTEGSGPHLALGKHNFRAPYYAERIARELGHTLVGQVVPFGVSNETLARYPGTIAVRSETFAALHEDVVRSLAHSGFTRVVLLTEHGPNVAVLQALAPRLDAELAPRGTRVVFSSDNYARSMTEIEAWGRANGVFAGRHGGLLDTSELWFVDESKVRPELVALGDTSATPVDSVQQVTGDPRRASVDLGEMFADIRVRNGVAEIRRLLDSLQ